MWGQYSIWYLKDLILRSVQKDMDRKEGGAISLERKPAEIGAVPPKKCSCSGASKSLDGPHHAHCRYRKTKHGRGRHHLLPNR